MQFMEMFLIAHQNYCYEQLYTKIESVWKGKEESEDDFILRISNISYGFHDNNRPLR